MKLSSSSAVLSLALLMTAWVTPSAAKSGVRGNHHQEQQRRLKSDESPSDSKDGDGEDGIMTVTNDETGQVYALINPAEEYQEPNENNGLVEQHACVSHQHALDFIASYTAENLESDEDCVQDPNSCGGGCCRMGYKLVCDEDNAFPQLPCICNQNTQDPSLIGDHPVVDEATTAGGTLDAANTVNVVEGAESYSTTNSNGTMGSPALINGTDFTIDYNATQITGTNITGTNSTGVVDSACVSHASAVAIVDALGARDVSDPDCLDEGKPNSCSGCCRIGTNLYCDADEMSGDSNPCVCGGTSHSFNGGGVAISRGNPDLP